MISVDEARQRILAAARPTSSEQVSLSAGLGRVPVSFEVTARAAVPPFSNSSMDGVALRAADTPGELRVVGEVAAGARTLPEVAPGTAVRITTGAPLPPGTDAVVPIEEVVSLAAATIRVPSARLGAFVRPEGEDTPAGSVVQLPAAPLTPATLGVLATLGVSEIAVRRRPRVAILSTGDELVAEDAPLGPGQIHDANGVALAAAVVEAGGDPDRLPVVGDDPDAIATAIGDACREADLLVVSGGVSVGGRDFVREVIEGLGSLELWRIRVQPGKPLAFGRIGGVPVVGLPGNPVSALVTFELFVRPLMLAMLGLAGDGRWRLTARSAERLAKDPEREAYLRVRLSMTEGTLVARAAGGQGSAQLRALSGANALLVVPAGVPAAEAGGAYEVLLIGPGGE